MKNKFNRILSSLLTSVMLFGVIASFIPPVSANAAYSSDVQSTNNYSEEEIAAILGKTLSYDFATAEEMLRYEMCDSEVSFDRDGDGAADVTYVKTNSDGIDITGNYLTSVTGYGGKYTIYVNSYTGYMYYVNNITGQIITSNPYNLTGIESAMCQDLVSQIELVYSSANTTGNTDNVYNSYKWAASYSQISVGRIANGLRVSYTLGDTTKRFLLPGAMTAESFDEYILAPMITEYERLLSLYAPSLNGNFLENPDSKKHSVQGVSTPLTLTVISPNKLKTYLQNTDTEAKRALGAYSDSYKALRAVSEDILNLLARYNFKSPLAEKAMITEWQKWGEAGAALVEASQQNLANMYAENPITEDDVAVYTWNEASFGLDSVKRTFSKVLKKYCAELDFNVMYEEEDICGYSHKATQKPVFRCVLEYSFNEDGSLSISLPANSLIFDETMYSLKSIIPLKHFGAGDMSTSSEGGYVFYPDGSGTVIDYKDFYATGINIKLQSKIFGTDYCYSTITGAHREQITMPVWGVVSAVRANAETKKNMSTDGYVENGYFAIIEEGASLAELGVMSSANYVSVYTSYVPYSLDYIVPTNVSVSGVTGYTKVTESKYNGSYVTRIVMLEDPDFEADVALAGGNFTPATYVGMATYYRNYLISGGVISPLPEANLDMPLYIEALGAMEVVEKFLTFPVTVSKQLTTFAEIETMYNELSDAKGTFRRKSQEYADMAAAITGDSSEDKRIKEKYLAYVEKYNELADSLEGIENINFKLSGFTNGGLTATYPVKLTWESVCGGKRGFTELVAAAKAVSDTLEKNFGVYPDFDFMYVNNTALFDGIGIKKTVSKMVDNRYASKQEYNAITRIYDILESMVVSPDNLGGYVDKFLSKYSSYNWKYVSVSTLGSDLNSNFDEDNPITREDASGYVKEALGKLGEYKVMLDKGNIYTIGYADHIINATIDSSHFRYSSYTVPFYGLVLHSFVNYTGSAFNYTGSPKYDILRAIENGASLYYILCYENTSYLKEDPILNKYYGIDYKNWFDKIVENYNELNGLIGNLQNHMIVDHRVLICERAVSDEEYEQNVKLLITELLGFIKEQTQKAVDAKFDELYASNPEGYDSVNVSFDLAAIKTRVAELLFLDSVSELESFGFDTFFDEIVKSYFDAEYPTATESGEKQFTVQISDFEYHYNTEVCTECGGTLNGENKCTNQNYNGGTCANYGTVVYNYRSAYSLVTGSDSTSRDYMYTDYTNDSGNVIIVTYKRASDGDTVRFILNYNTFDVTVRLGDEIYPVDKYGYCKLDN